LRQRGNLSLLTLTIPTTFPAFAAIHIIKRKL
jgi:hypothetical protein